MRCGEINRFQFTFLSFNICHTCISLFQLNPFTRFGLRNGVGRWKTWTFCLFRWKREGERALFLFERDHRIFEIIFPIAVEPKMSCRNDDSDRHNSKLLQMVIKVNRRVCDWSLQRNTRVTETRHIVTRSTIVATRCQWKIIPNNSQMPQTEEKKKNFLWLECQLFGTIGTLQEDEANAVCNWYYVVYSPLNKLCRCVVIANIFTALCVCVR